MSPLRHLIGSVRLTAGTAEGEVVISDNLLPTTVDFIFTDDRSVGPKLQTLEPVLRSPEALCRIIGLQSEF